MMKLELEKFGFMLETYGAGKEEIFPDIDINSLKNTNFLIAGDTFCGKTFSTKLSILRQHKEKDFYVFSAIGEYNKLVNSLDGVILTENFNEFPDKNLVLYDFSGTRFDDIAVIIEDSLRNLFRNFNKNIDRERIVILDEIWLLDLHFFKESEILQKIVKNSKSLNMSVVILINPFKYTTRGLFYLNTVKTWRAVLENTAVKACFRPGAIPELGFNEWDTVVNPGEGYLSYPVQGYGNVPFSVLPTEEEIRHLI